MNYPSDGCSFIWLNYRISEGERKLSLSTVGAQRGLGLSEPALNFHLGNRKKWWRNTHKNSLTNCIARGYRFLCWLPNLRCEILMDPAMNVKAGMKSQTFRNCRLQIVTGEHSLSTQDGGECVVDVFDDTNNNSLDIRIRSGE